MIKKLWKALSKTRDKISGFVKKEPSYEEIEKILILSDAGFDTTKDIIERAKKEKGSPLTSVKKVIIDILDVEKNINNSLPYTIVVVGVNGAGKTTTVAKLGYNFKNTGKKVILGAADTYRDAGVLQLEKWSKKYGIDIVKAEMGQDPGAVAYDTLQKTITKNYDIAIIDTAGRLHTRDDLMRQVKKIIHAASKSKGGAVNEVLLTLDATSGQNTIVQAETFNQTSEITGLIITKLDGTAKAGFIFGIVKKLKIPVKYIGVGENIDDLLPFNKEEFVNALLGIESQ